MSVRPALAIAVVLLAAQGPASMDRNFPSGHKPLPTTGFNDNQMRAGNVSGGVLRVTLRARLANWYPNGDRRPAPIVVAAFSSDSGGPTIPGPLIRVRAGTRVRVRVVNQLPSGKPLVMHGLQRRPAATPDTLRVKPGGSREIEFDPGAPGTYFYWGAISDTTTIEGRSDIDSQLDGALIVDPASGPIAPDRIFVLGVYFHFRDSTNLELGADKFAAVINGRSWPLTERFDFNTGDTVHWRWINPTVDNHPMHLHGFFYRVDAKGTELADTAYSPEQKRMVVTHRLDPGGTMAMTWSPSTPGNWLMHCHIHAHTAADPRDGLAPPAATAHASHTGTMARMDDMAGLLLGIQVRASSTTAAYATPPPPAQRRLRLALGPAVLRPDGMHVRVGLTDPNGPVADVGTPGPPIVLTRGEPAEITVVNSLDEPTAIHWHGLELESYYDGVAGWSGAGQRVAQQIAPGDSFVARMTPPRSGTFIYHAHNLATKQVGFGLLGPLIVTEPGEPYDPSHEIVWIVSGEDVGENGFLRLNGTRWPEPITVDSGRTYHVRIINITENNTGDVALLDGEAPVEWTPLAKDAAPLPPMYRATTPAKVRASVGETYDFEWRPARRGTLRLEVRNSGNLMTVQKVEVR